MKHFISATGTVFVFSLFVLTAFSNEKLERGLIALERGDGSVYIGWRKLSSDDANTSYHIIAKRMGATALEKPWNETTRNTNAIQKDVKKGEVYTYTLDIRSEGGGRQHAGACKLKITGNEQPYIGIPLAGDYDAQKVGVGDLDGDGDYEYVIKQPNFNTDPYQHPGYWKPSTTTYKIEAYDTDGTLLWRYDMGWSIEAGIWYSPWIVYDVDGDGKAEVYCKAGEGDPRDNKGLVKDGLEYLVKIDGETGKVVAKTDWLSRDGFVDYNRFCRNFLTVAYLDGKTPSLIMQRGTYKLIKTMALDKDFNKIWYWEADESKPKYRGQGAHGLTTADVDLDGRDELVIGAAVIDDNGKELWTLGMGHPDVFYVADIDWDNPGLEIYYGFETRQDTDGLTVVDAKTGKKLWTHKKETHHIHSQGMAADVLAEYPGMEVYGGERDYDQRWFYSAKGKLIKLYEKGTLSPRAVWWDADPQKEVYRGRSVSDWNGKELQKIEGRLIGIADCVGDAREELITVVKGELRIYTTTIPWNDSRVCLMQDRQYRLGVTAETMGYFYPPQLSELHQ